MVCKLLRRAALAAVVFSFAGQARADLGMAQSVSVMSQPSESRKLSFPQAGIIKETLVKDGDKVKAGQALVRQDTDLDQKEAERLRVEAEKPAELAHAVLALIALAHHPALACPQQPGER